MHVLALYPQDLATNNRLCHDGWKLAQESAAHVRILR